jgi:uncharacterized membrane protein
MTSAMSAFDEVIKQHQAANRKRLQAYRQTTLDGAAVEASIAKANKQAVAQLGALTLCVVPQNPS